MIHFMGFTLPFFVWVLLPTGLAHPARNEAQIHQPVTAETQADPGSLASLASNSVPTITSIPSPWALELKRQNTGSITTCVPLQAYESCSPSCSSDAMATTCSSILLPFCFVIEKVFALDSTVTLLDCAATGTTFTSHVNPTTPITITSRSSSTSNIVTLIASTVGSTRVSSEATPSGATSIPASGNGSGIPTDFGVSTIVGATIGGATIIVLLAVWARMVRVRRKRQKAVAASPSTESSSDAVLVEKRSDRSAHTTRQSKPSAVPLRQP